MFDYIVQREMFEGWLDVPECQLANAPLAFAMIKKLVAATADSELPDTLDDYRVAIKEQDGGVIKTIQFNNGVLAMADLNTVLDMRVAVGSAAEFQAKGIKAVSEIDYGQETGIVIKGCVDKNKLYLAFIESKQNDSCSVTNCAEHLINFAENQLKLLGLNFADAERVYYEIDQQGNIDSITVENNTPSWKPIFSGKHSRSRAALIGVAGRKVASFLLN
ncbi:MAG: hypothetical protein ACTS9Y_01090 [Methylophilus sp.]|uniref:hypothetical protein n=1 Tax=Methylophilus sp. TaxID=29541 RepID=UPI003F9EEE7D